MKYILKYSEILIVSVILMLSIRFTNNERIVHSDGNGYFAYLPATIIYGDLTYSFYDDIKEKYYEGKGQDYRVKVNNKTINKNWPGVAILWAPFYIVAHIISTVTNLPNDGYANIYQYSIIAAAMFYLLLGLYFLRKFLKLYHIKPFYISAIQAIIVFATPLYHYATRDVSFTHTYSFVFIMIFFYYVKTISIEYSFKKLFTLALIFGMIIIIRPVNGLVFTAIPFICGSWKSTHNLFQNVFKNPKHLLVSFLALIFILSIIPILYKIQVNQWFVWQYKSNADKTKNVGFNFSEINIHNILFSFRNGLFIYSPALFLSFIGFIALLWKRKYFQPSAFLVSFLLITYVLSSWQAWWYGMSYGMRTMVDYLPMFVLLFVFAFKIAHKRIAGIIIALSAIFIILNVIQEYQYRKYIFFWKMDKELYSEVFLKTSKKYHGYLWKKCGSYVPKDYISESKDSLVKIYDVKNIFLDAKPYFIDSTSFNGKVVAKFNPKKLYLTGLPSTRKDSLFKNKIKYFIINAQADVFIPDDRIENVFSLVVSSESGYQLYKALHSEYINLETNIWETINTQVKVDGNIPDSSVFKVYLWQRGEKPIFVNNFEVQIFVKN